MEKLLDNCVRGRRTVFWMEAFIVVVFLLYVLLFAMLQVSGGFPQEMNSDALPMAFFLILLGLFAVSIVITVVFVIFLCYWIAWMYRSVTNFRLLGMTKLHPLVAVIVSVLPYVGFLAHAFVFREMVLKLDRKLSNLNVSHPQVSMNQVGAFVLLNLIGIVMPLVSNGSMIVNLVISAVAGLASIVFYVLALTVYVKQEKLLFTAGQEEILRRKVDEVIRQRDAGLV